MVGKTSVEQLARFIHYVLGRRPDEFGLIPDGNGFVKFKDFLKAVNEEDGWRFVRRSHIDEILISPKNTPIEVLDDRIRATDRTNLPFRLPADPIPKLLYACIRRRAYPVVLERGIFPGESAVLVLSSDLAMAERIGRRIDISPITLTVQTAKAMAGGVVFQRFGEMLYEAAFLPSDCFTGPAMPKEKKEDGRRQRATEKQAPRMPGSFFVDFSQNKKDNRSERPPGSGDKDARTKKKFKRKRQPPPWRS